MKDICKYHQTGYCKHGKQCNRTHVNEICSKFKECNEINCIRRHPKTCKYFTIFKYCKFDNCAYLHENSGSNPCLKLLEKDIAGLKSEIDQLKVVNKKLNNSIKNINEQLSTTFSIVFERINNLEKELEEQKSKESVIEKISPEAQANSLSKVKPMKNTAVIKKTVNDKSKKSQEHKCNQCDFKGKSTVILNKHMNTKHYVNETNDKGTMNDVECSLCDYKVSSINMFQEHISEHLEEIEVIDIDTLTNDEDMFECDMCSFESGNENSVRDHLIEHVMVPKLKKM